MHVNIDIAVEVARQPKSLRARAHVRHRRLGRLLHHVAQLAGQGELALAVDDGRFRAEDRTADFGPGQAGNQSHFAAFMRQGIAELDHTQVIVDVVLCDCDVVIDAFLNHFARDFAADVPDFALQVAHARLARVRPDQARISRRQRT